MLSLILIMLSYLYFRVDTCNHKIISNVNLMELNYPVVREARIVKNEVYKWGIL